MIKGLEDLPCVEGLKGLVLFSLEKTRLKGPHCHIPVLKGSFKEGRGSVFARSHVGKARGNMYKMYWKRFYLGIRK